MHVDLNTAFLQWGGGHGDAARDVACQLQLEATQPWYMGARLNKPPHGMNDAPRSWWHRFDASLRSYELQPTRAARCC